MIRPAIPSQPFWVGVKNPSGKGNFQTASVAVADPKATTLTINDNFRFKFDVTLENHLAMGKDSTPNGKLAEDALRNAARGAGVIWN